MEKEEFLQKILEELPAGKELEIRSIDNEIDFQVPKEEIFEICKFGVEELLCSVGFNLLWKTSLFYWENVI